MKHLLLRTLLILAAAFPLKAEISSLDLFANFPVLEGGRVIPMDTFARQKLLMFSGKSTFNREPAVNWMAEVFFAPHRMATQELFLVDNPEVLQAVGLDAEGRGRYTYADLEEVIDPLRGLASRAMQLEDSERSPVEKEVLRLFHNLSQYRQLTQALAFAVPADIFSVRDPENLALLGMKEPGMTSFARLWSKAEAMTASLREAERTGEKTPAQREMMNLASAMSIWSRNINPGGTPAMLPVQGHDKDWISPWDAIMFRVQDPSIRDAVADLGAFGEAYLAGLQVPLDLAGRTYLSAVTRQLDRDTSRNLKWEIRFNKAKLFTRAETLYGLGFLLGMVSLVSRRKLVYRAAVLLTVLALVPHTLGIIARMEIMGRPPVTNLYSTFIFVGWMSAILCLVLEYLQRNRLGLAAAAVSGLAMLLTSGRFANEGDTMGVMVAVLDSNFWLATHVITITMGYAGCVASGVIGHIYLVQAIFRKEDDAQLDETYRAVYGIQAFGLIFAFLGTMLGGVWADQSWGRFWGWDPKENGALVIVLWSAILFHAKACRMIGPRGFAAGSIIGIVFVLMAWIGVNLLGVGLHSYGFTSSLAIGLLVATAVEVSFIAAVLPLSRSGRQQANREESSHV